MASIDQAERERRSELVRHVQVSQWGVPDAGERDLMCNFLRRFAADEFPFAAAAEWEFVPGRTDLGKGDLAFTDAAGVRYRRPHLPCNVLIVEVKLLRRGTGRTTRVRNRQHRVHGQDQVWRSMRSWKTCHPNDHVVGALITNDTGATFAAYGADGTPEYTLRNPLASGLREDEPAWLVSGLSAVIASSRLGEAARQGSSSGIWMAAGKMTIPLLPALQPPAGDAVCVWQS